MQFEVDLKLKHMMNVNFSNIHEIQNSFEIHSKLIQKTKPHVQFCRVVINCTIKKSFNIY
jgi:hypothetical protein